MPNLLPSFAGTVSANVAWTIDYVRWHAQLGADAAELTATGSDYSLVQLENLVGTTLTIQDAGEVIWCGVVDRVEVELCGCSMVVDIGQLANCVIAKYSFISDNQNDRTKTRYTEFACDEESVARYGRHEYLLEIGEATTAQAIARRDGYLAANKWPVRSYELGSGKARKATVHAIGYGQTLCWQLYRPGMGYAGNTETGDQSLRFGRLNYERLAQPFTAVGTLPWQASYLSVRPRKRNNPGDSMTVALHGDGGGVPGVALAVVTVPNAEVPTAYDWVEYAISPVTLTPGQQYWVVLGRTGALNESDHYRAQYSEVNLGDGELYTWTGVAAASTGGVWLRFAEADLLFRVIGQPTTQAVIEDLLAAATYLDPDCTIEYAFDTALLALPQWEDEYRAVCDLLEEIMATGLTDGRRLLATIDCNACIRLYPQPAETDPAGSIDCDNTIYNTTGSRVSKARNRAGRWYSLRDQHFGADARIWAERYTYRPCEDSGEIEQT